MGNGRGGGVVRSPHGGSCLRIRSGRAEREDGSLSARVCDHFHTGLRRNGQRAPWSRRRLWAGSVGRQAREAVPPASHGAMMEGRLRVSTPAALVDGGGSSVGLQCHPGSQRPSRLWSQLARQ